MGTEFCPHEIIWTPEKIGRFWGYFAHNKACEENFFSRMVGDAIINLASCYRELGGNILDYGCGHGFLIEKLLKRGTRCEGLEFSTDSAGKVEQKFRSEKNFGGVTIAQCLPTPLEADKYDLVFILETIEHLLPQWLDQTISEIYRITTKGGLILATVPNEEKLEARKVMCPECGGIFHTVQHISSWTEETLVSRMSSVGFQCVMCKSTRLRESGRFSHVRYIAMLLAYKLTGRKLPHLIYIGKKPA